MTPIIGSLWNTAPERQTFSESVKWESGHALWEAGRFARALGNALRRMRGIK